MEGRRFARLAFAVALAVLVEPAVAQTSDGDWPIYNRTLEGDRFSPLAAITPANVAGMHQICAYDFKRQTNFQSGPIVVGGLLFVTTDVDTVALDPATCAQSWRVTETYEAGWPVNRGAAYLDGRLFRGMQDGRVLAYDAATGKRLWQRTIADPKLGELVSAAPIAWQDL